MGFEVSGTIYMCRRESSVDSLNIQREMVVIQGRMCQRIICCFSAFVTEHNEMSQLKLTVLM